MTGRTPGPWTIQRRGRDDNWIVADAEGTPIAELWYVSSTETPANAQLLAAAPDLLSAAVATLSRIETLLSHPEPEVIMDDFLTGAAEYLRDAIGKATERDE